MCSRGPPVRLRYGHRQSLVPGAARGRVFGQHAAPPGVRLTGVREGSGGAAHVLGPGRTVLGGGVEGDPARLLRVERGDLDRDCIIVVRGQGPRANGMPELHKLMPLMGALQDRGFHVALATDGRMSGASGKVLAAIHITPEAAEGGPLAKVRDGEVWARMGGDEFVILLPQIHRADKAVRVAHKVLEVLKPSFQFDGHELHITTSMGISLYPYDGEDADSLLKNADTALYRAKEQGRNNYQLYTPAMNARAFERLALENSLRKALERKEFSLHYQPQLDMEASQIVGVEARVVSEGKAVRGGEVETGLEAVSYTHLRAHETVLERVCRLLLDKKK